MPFEQQLLSLLLSLLLKMVSLLQLQMLWQKVNTTLYIPLTVDIFSVMQV